MRVAGALGPPGADPYGTRDPDPGPAAAEDVGSGVSGDPILARPPPRMSARAFPVRRAWRRP
jgi:hypothetical protein